MVLELTGTDCYIIGLLDQHIGGKVEKLNSSGFFEAPVEP